MNSIARAIAASGTTCAILDGTAACILFTIRGISIQRGWQGVASGLLGASSFQRGWQSAALGILVHIFIAFTASAVFVLAARSMPWLLDHAVVAGMLYGIAIHLFMTFVVIPLSAIGRRPFVLRLFLIQLAIHIFIVGLAIALPARQVLR